MKMTSPRKLNLAILIFGTVLTVTSYYSVEASAYLRCYQNSITDYEEAPLEQASELINKSYIRLNQELDIVIHGYIANVTVLIEDIIENLITAFGDTKSYCAFNWYEEANAYLANVTKPLKNVLGGVLVGFDQYVMPIIAGQIGKNLGMALIEMTKHGLKTDDVYLIGHSEGAHLAAAAGRETNKTGNLIGRVTGLDPAKPGIAKYFDKSCAKFVDAVHTNTRLFREGSPVGQVDFFLNDGCYAQPGCPQRSLFVVFDRCSITRALLIMADAIKYPDSLQGRKATSYYNFYKSDTAPEKDDINYIGFHVIPSNNGSFYLCTNKNSIFGKYAEGMDPQYCKCSA